MIKESKCNEARIWGPGACILYTVSVGCNGNSLLTGSMMPLSFLKTEGTFWQKRITVGEILERSI